MDQTIQRGMAHNSAQELLADSEVVITVDIKKAALHHIDFLKTVNQHPQLYSGRALQEAIRRYEQCWLPLMVRHRNRKIAPPLDVHWVWHCHMLAPCYYVKDCELLIGELVDHQLGLHVDEEARELGKDLWKDLFPNENYDPFKVTGDAVNNYNRQSSYDLETAAGRQAVFYYQVALPHYRELSYLEDAFKRYCRFLFLKKSYPDSFIVPSYDIDLMWHTHQLFPLAYKSDTEATLGHHFNHDDSVNDRASGSKLIRSWEKTKDNWKALYGEVYSRAGGMYRGPPPAGWFTDIDNNKCCTKTAMLKITKCQLKGTDTADEHIVLAVGRDSSRVLLRGPSVEWHDPAGLLSNTVNSLDTSAYDVPFALYHQRVPGPDVSPDMLIGEVTCSLTEVVRSAFDDNSTSRKVVVKLPKKPTNGDTSKPQQQMALTFELVITDIQITSQLTMKVISKVFHSVRTDEDLQTFWGPLPVVGIFPPARSYHADHTLQNAAGEDVLTARVIHSTEQRFHMSAIQLYHCGKMAAMAHMAHIEQLPVPAVPTDMMLPVPVVRYQIGERAMLIKDNQGDWGLCLGSWCRPAKPFYISWLNMLGWKRSRNQDTGKALGIWKEDEEFLLRFYEFRSEKWTQKTLNWDNWCNFSIGKLTIDMSSGVLHLQSVDEDFAQQVSLGFAVAILVTLTRPVPGTSTEAPESSTVAHHSMVHKHTTETVTERESQAGVTTSKPGEHDQKVRQSSDTDQVMLEASGYFLNFPGRMCRC